MIASKHQPCIDFTCCRAYLFCVGRVFCKRAEACDRQGPTKGVDLRVANAEADEALAVRARHDRTAFGVLYERHVQKIYNYMYYRTGNSADAEDLTERTFFQALSNLHRYEYQGVPFSAWLFRIAHNLVANWHRDGSRRRALPLDAVAELPNPYDDPPSLSESAEERRELLAAIAQLPEDRQQLIILKFVEQLPNAEIARIMGRTEGAVKALLHRTVVALKEQLQAGKAGKKK